jgi:hypothetical protein
MLISTALLLDSNIRNSVCTPAKLPCRRVEVGYEKNNNNFYSENTYKYTGLTSSIKILIFVNYILIKVNVY